MGSSSTTVGTQRDVYLMLLMLHKVYTFLTAGAFLSELNSMFWPAWAILAQLDPNYLK